MMGGGARGGSGYLWVLVLLALCVHAAYTAPSTLETLTRAVKQAAAAGDPAAHAAALARRAAHHRAHQNVPREVDDLERAFQLRPLPETALRLSYILGMAPPAAEGSGRHPLKVLTDAAHAFPSHVALHNELGIEAYNHGEYELSLQAFSRVLELDPANTRAFCVSTFVLRAAMRLDEAAARMPRLVRIIEAELDASEALAPDSPRSPLCVSPAETMFYPLPHQVLQRVLRHYAALELHRARVPASSLSLPSTNMGGRGSSQQEQEQENDDDDNEQDDGQHGALLHVGFVSPDFREHAVADLIAPFLSQLGPSVSVSCYALRPVTSDSPAAREVARACGSHMHDVSGVHRVQEVVQLMRGHRLDVLVDLAGWTADHRIPLYAARPAKLQLVFLGFPGTTGTTFFDHLVTDAATSPPHLAHLYTERLAYLPTTWLVNNWQERFGAEVHQAEYYPTRADFGLPADAVVFGSFAQFLKIDHELFTVWMNILRRVPGSVLYVVRVSSLDGELGMEGLRQQAVKHGVDPARIRFQPRIIKGKHMLVEQLVDVALDTVAHNGATTSLDLVFAGVPVLTTHGHRMSTRITQSLLRGHPTLYNTLVVPDLAAYEEQAVALGQDSTLRATVRGMAKEYAARSALFETQRHAADLARLLQAAWEVKVAASNTTGMHLVL